MIFLRDSFCLSAVSLSRQRHNILDFSCCPLSRVLHVTLANGQGFGFEFHLRSSPSAFSGFVNISRPADYFTTCYTVLTRPKKVETAVRGCNSWLSVWTLSCRCPVALSKQLLAEVFVISRIIEVEVGVISRSRRLRLITLTETSIILDITKTESNNCFIIHWTEKIKVMFLLLYWRQAAQSARTWHDYP